LARQRRLRLKLQELRGSHRQRQVVVQQVRQLAGSTGQALQPAADASALGIPQRLPNRHVGVQRQDGLRAVCAVALQRPAAGHPHPVPIAPGVYQLAGPGPVPQDRCLRVGQRHREHRFQQLVGDPPLRLGLGPAVQRLGARAPVRDLPG
jgi:hypothetical protein